MEVKFVDLGRQYASLRDELLGVFDELSHGGQHVLSEWGRRFEREFASYCGVAHAIGVGSGSDALYLTLRALDIGPGDEVITAPNSFVATAAAIARTGARIVFCDVRQDLNIDPELIEHAVTPATRAILPVHLTGRIADMDAIDSVAKRHELIVIEDAAQAVGATLRGRRAGSFGRAAGFSLHPLKNLHVHGDGGIITTDDDDLRRRLEQERNHGLVSRDTCEFWGINSRLDGIHAAVAERKLRHLDPWNERCRQLAHRYSVALEPHVGVPADDEQSSPVYHRYVIRCPDRDQLQRHLAAAGIETFVNYPIPLHLQPAASELGYGPGSFPVAERLANTMLSLPLHAFLTDDEQRYVIQSVVSFFGGI